MLVFCPYVFLPKWDIGRLWQIIYLWCPSTNFHASKQKASFIHVSISDLVLSSGKHFIGMGDERRLGLLFSSYWKMTYLSIVDFGYLLGFLQCSRVHQVYMWGEITNMILLVWFDKICTKVLQYLCVGIFSYFTSL